MKPKIQYMAVIMLWALPLLLTVPNAVLSITEQYYSIAARIANVALPAGIYLLIAAWSRRIGRTALLMIPLMVLCAFQIVLIFLYGESIIAIDMFLNVVTTNVHEASELLRNLGPAIAVVCALYLPLIIGGIVLCVKRCHTTLPQRRAARMAGIGLSAVGAAAFAVSFAMPGGYRPERELFPVNVCYNMGVASCRTVQAKEYGNTSADFTFDAVAGSTGPEVVVLVVGETTRADNWQLNGYGRPTNPKLSGRRHLVSYKKALSESNTTHKSVPLLMSHLDAASFGDSIYEVKSVITAFGEAGYRTAWISNQQRNGSLIDFFGEEADSVRFLADEPGPHYDMDIIPHLSRIISADSTERTFVVLHTYGSHFNYTERYPQKFAAFTPDRNMNAEKNNRSELVNAYDNTVRYIDSMLDSVISVLAGSGRPAAMLYLTDHGEDIFDDSRCRFLHASPTPTYWQLHVPVLLWLSDEYVAEYPERYAAARANECADVSSSRSAFHTLLSLGNVGTPFFDASADLTSGSYRLPARLYLTDYNEAAPLGRAGLGDPDYAKLAEAGISVQ